MVNPALEVCEFTVGTIVGLMASGYTIERILKAYPYLESEDIYQALAYAAWRTERNRSTSF